MAKVSRKGVRGRAPMTRSEQMARIHGRDTNPEMELRRALWHLGARYRLRVKLPGSPDLVFLGKKVAVFVDGCFWHGCPLHYKPPTKNPDFWIKKLQVNQARDQRVDLQLEAMGWRPVRIWEHEIHEDVTIVALRILAILGPPILSDGIDDDYLDGDCQNFCV